MYREKYEYWLSSPYVDDDGKIELKNIEDEKEIEDRFYKDLEFGTGGLRGVIGIGSNRMNIYTVGKATEGLSKYLIKKYNTSISVCIAYDCRIMSKEFAEAAASNLCANGIEVNLFKTLHPTPMLSYAVRELKSKAGVVITASHNPKQYNGYKVYGEDGGQVTDDFANEILSCIESISDFSEIKHMDLKEAENKGILHMLGENIDKSYIEKVKNLAIRKDLIEAHAKDLKIIYTPLHGTGNIPVRRALKELGYENVNIVKEQESPDGSFPTAEYPNPEDPRVFKLALDMAQAIKPDIIFGTDPDCDRIGIVVKNVEGQYKTLTGNQVGVLLTHYILSSLKEIDKLPKNGVVVKTIVTTEMVQDIAKEYGVELVNVLTGFKYIGEKIKEFKSKENKEYIFGFEESYGYLAGDFVRDKDAVIAATLICEMTLYYKTKGMSLYEALLNLYKKYGFYKEKLISVELKGREGHEKIEKILQYMRHSMKRTLGDAKIVKKLDYKLSVEKDLININENIIHLPKSNVLKFIMEDKSWFVVRPSGTEPKIKIYLSIIGNSLKDAEEKMNVFEKRVMKIIDDVNC
ncbi:MULTISPECIES: phospho-sugar mutase [Clostridium]|uniref:phosphoglucomutase (alpha-D-glucose-1,6-bisphosphate-dependent) n=4 Tax=Clostridium TaxID=1485 RepID=D8GS84_CLOLD|nr:MULTISPECIES: phospho-sugar mutase [Clostridium]ADK16466.1 phosphoglucomutase [Clostridium ljungdahlii DSM 13528]AGY75545.1 phospho-sugar mutase [Clostridium autoethanogenum DSM 10061]ALU35710.1 Phosphoglucomutase [Clostridium autoethanogenum DSM 10061]OAA89658.1 Phosphoglucomutase [Clostridium ljungdahlii DSM 13528]OAA94551.1 Phosphoglucomutase [Clostridium coskatii]